MRYTRRVLVAAIAGTTALAAPVAAEAAAPTRTEVVRDGVTLLLDRTPVSVKPYTGKGASRADFDGDNRDDVAVFSNVGVAVAYSSAAHRDVLRTEIPGSGGGGFGYSMAAGDFNGDRYDDLAIGDYNEADLRTMGYVAGAVWIIPGGPGGLQPNRAQHVNQSTAGVPGVSVQGDWFGFSLAAGDITGDGRDELAIGIPRKRIGNKAEAGAVVVLKGGANGVTTSAARWISQDTAGVPGSPGTNDKFGFAVAIGRVDKNRYQELVVGAPGESPDRGYNGSGTITQFWGTSAGASLKKVTALHGGKIATTVRKLGVWEVGAALAIGDVTGDGYSEVVCGVSGAQAGAEIYGGMVVTVPGRTTGLSAKGAIAISQSSPGVAGAAESDDRFGDSIAVGDVTLDGRADVLVGVPGENNGAGAVVLLRGSAKGLTGARSQTLTQSSAGVPDGAERGDRFGANVALLNLNGSGGVDALVAAPAEQVAGDHPGYGSGTVTRFLGGYRGLGNATLTSGRFLDPNGVGYGGHIAR
ncbi:FG-GAP-like repeat-containing protein [Actinoplanes flavus]|uniref:VCBS repeat-containing protein n=1 Tax=Actinoplanes flavus TaxID=2820290 RepID=A0ABS3UMT2_9ACTN|nr:FG-GAP-like repeat-containing protein [Actinoplanes flavus]MBO3740097.1 VCBS repeat-containing protein [Actinoplanes flavus]